MKCNFPALRMLTLILLLCAVSLEASAAREYVTFESFYKESTYLSWMIAGAVAIVAGAVIFFTGGTASPIVVSIGTWVGGLMGLSGAAATNAGLALLGGGSVAAGGFGVIGGTALLTAALTFGTEIAFDYAVEKAITEYDYQELQEQSKNMLTLPIPVETKGGEAHEMALDILSEIDAPKGELVLNVDNRAIIDRAIGSLVVLDYSNDVYVKLRRDSLLALLYFILGDFEQSHEYSKLALDKAEELETRRTLPAFINSVSQLYFEDFDFEKVVKNFSYAVLEEPDNPLTPLLFSIFMDRAMLRFNDDRLDYSDLTPVVDLMQDKSIRKFRTINYANLMSRQFMRLKLEQQKILNFNRLPNAELSATPGVLDVAETAMSNYSGLLKSARKVLEAFFDEELNDEARRQVGKFSLLLVDYTQDEARLANMVEKMGEGFTRVSPKLDKDDTSAVAVTKAVALLLLGFIVVALVISRYRRKSVSSN